MLYGADVTQLLISLKEVSEGVGYVSELATLCSLALIEESPLYQEFIRKGFNKKQIEKKITELYMKHEERESDYNKEYRRIFETKESPDDGLIFKHMILVTNEDGAEISYIITTILSEILERTVIITKEHNCNVVNMYFMLIAFAEYIPDIYNELIESVEEEVEDEDTDVKLGEKTSKNDFVIPKNLDSFLTVLNDKYSSDEESCKILGRAEETEMLIKVLSKATKRNAILVGYPGVGKSAIVEKFVWNIVKGNCPDRFKKIKVLSLDVTAIIADTKYRGTAELRFKELIQFLEQNPEYILFIDEVHTILGAGACKDGELDLANALKPILASGNTRVIGATTFDEYERYFSKDSALKRRFEKIIVREPKTDELYDMIKNQILSLEKFHNTKISKELVDFAILNASCFNYETKNPDRTLDLLDRTMAGTELKGKTEVSKEDILENFTIRRKQFEKMSEKRKMSTAYHEAGHYIVQYFAPELQYYHTLAVSILPAEDYLGVNVLEEDEYVTPSCNKDFYIQRIAGLLAGRRAEKIYTKELSSGANSDLEKATKIAKDMITRYGLDEDFTEDRVYLRDSENPMYTEKIIERISSEIDKILSEAKRYADYVLIEHQTELEILVKELMEKGIVSKVELERIVTDNIPTN